MTPIVTAAAFLRRDWLLARSYRVNFALRVLSPLLILALFFYIGKLLDRGGVRLAGRGGYFSFVLGGIVVGRMMHVGFAAFAQRLREEQTTGTLEAVLATPLRPRAAILGLVTYELFDSMADVILTLLCGVLIFGASISLSSRTFTAAFIVGPATLALLSAVGVAIAAVAVVFKNPEGLMSLVATAIELLAGVYFPVRLLPEPLRALAEISPFTWAVDAIRAGLIGGTVEAWKVAGLVGLGFVSLPVALWIFERAVDRARRDGSLAQY